MASKFKIVTYAICLPDDGCATSIKGETLKNKKTAAKIPPAKRQETLSPERNSDYTLTFGFLFVLHNL